MAGVFYANLKDGSTTLVLRGDSWDEDPYFLRELDLGWPTPREVVSDAAGRNGVVDYTSLFGARTVTAHLYVRASDAVGATINTNLDALRAICTPNRRITMEVMRDGWVGPRRITLRATAFSCVINKTSHVYAEAQLSWSAPSGILDSLADVVTEISPIFESAGFSLVPGDPGDLALALIPGDSPAVALVLTPGTGQNIQSVTNPGSLPASPTYTIQGPCDNPQIINRDTSQRIVFNNFSVPAGSAVVLDTAAHTVTLNGTSVYSRVDWGRSRWFTLPPGVTVMEFDVDGSDTGCRLFIRFSPRYI